MGSRLLASFEDAVVAELVLPNGFLKAFNRWSEEQEGADEADEELRECVRQLRAFHPLGEEPPSQYFVDAYTDWVKAWRARPSGDPLRAYAEGDADASRAAHRCAKEEHDSGLGEYTKSLVFGGLDGILSTFAMVCAIQGGRLSLTMVFVLGFAEFVSGAIGMALGDYLSSVAEIRYQRAEREREEWELDNYPEGEQEEMVSFYMDRGLEECDARELVSILMRDREVFLNVMMVQELEILPEEDSPATMALVTFLSFLLFGAMPLLVYFVFMFVPGASSTVTFVVSCFTVAATLFALGALKSKFTADSWWRAGLIVLVYGFVGAFCAYALGWLVQVILEVVGN